MFTFHEQEVIGHRANPLLYRSFEKQKEIFIACTSIRRDLEMILRNEEVPMVPTFSGERAARELVSPVQGLVLLGT